MIPSVEMGWMLGSGHSRPLAALAVFVLLGPLAFKSPAAPSTLRRDVSLDGAWNFVTDPEGSLKTADLASAKNVRPAMIPGSWQSEFDDLRDYAGVGWYWTSFDRGDLAPGQVVLLHCAAVDYFTEIYINGQKVGTHEGGYLPFGFDITPALHPGVNQVALRVVDPGKSPPEVEGIKFAEIPHGKQSWYVQTSGPWQGIEIDIRPHTYLRLVHVRGGADGKFQIEASIANPAVPVRMQAEILDPAGQSAWQGSADVKPGQGRYPFSGQILSPSLWSPGHPALYTLQVRLDSGDTGIYPFGFRTFEAHGGKFYLNGKLIYLRGALDQDFYPDTGYTAPSLDALKAEMATARQIGLNLLRCHIKVPDPRYLEAADQTGMLVWYEIPSWDKLTTDSKRRAAETLRGMVERDWNHPCIVIVSIINESWGANLKEAPDREWLKQSYHEAKALVPRWLVDDNSACCDNFHLASDLADFHNYDAIPDHADDFDRFVTDLATRPGWLFSPYGDAEPTGTEPLMLSEFGNWGLPRIPEHKPWWFGRGFGDDEFTSPSGVEQRFVDYRYPSLFKNLDELAGATEDHELESLKFEIETLRLHPEIQGYVITEFTDVNWEANGLLDMWRNKKLDGVGLAALGQDDLVIARVAKHNYQAGETVRANLTFSHFSDQSLSGVQINWNLVDTPVSGTFPPLPLLTPGQVAKVGTIVFQAPAVTQPAREFLKVKVTSGQQTLFENSVPLFFYPPDHPELPPTVAFEDPTGDLRRLITEMRRRGYQPPSGSEALPVLIASTFDDKVKQTLTAGGRVILLVTEPATLAAGLEVKRRAGSNLSGDWISDFLWVRADQGPFKHFGFGKMAGFETEAITPPAVLVGIPPQHFDDVLSGLFYGWIRSSAGTLVQATYGKGKLLICTFGLATAYASDPYATLLLDSLVNYVVGGFSPGYAIPTVEK